MRRKPDVLHTWIQSSQDFSGVVQRLHAVTVVDHLGHTSQNRILGVYYTNYTIVRIRNPLNPHRGLECRVTRSTSRIMGLRWAVMVAGP